MLVLSDFQLLMLKFGTDSPRLPGVASSAVDRPEWTLRLRSKLSTLMFIAAASPVAGAADLDPFIARRRLILQRRRPCRTERDESAAAGGGRLDV
ncbi:Hypothetical protein NTJ_04900 [Nesidiocoris tenuis]|uniref:Uncharacterized protein n=1 Tax=Nesidiocoris tenuis TaxID=355587 RepID=A0ABN7ANX2_9HEMI|nr:Hypothetical protein NTJ_04900 [Nesidiocoris tenuis]